MIIHKLENCSEFIYGLPKFISIHFAMVSESRVNGNWTSGDLPASGDRTSHSCDCSPHSVGSPNKLTPLWVAKTVLAIDILHGSLKSISRRNDHFHRISEMEIMILSVEFYMLCTHNNLPLFSSYLNYW